MESFGFCHGFRLGTCTGYNSLILLSTSKRRYIREEWKCYFVLGYGISPFFHKCFIVEKRDLGSKEVIYSSTRSCHKLLKLFFETNPMRAWHCIAQHHVLEKLKFLQACLSQGLQIIEYGTNPIVEKNQH